MENKTILNTLEFIVHYADGTKRKTLMAIPKGGKAKYGFPHGVVSAIGFDDFNPYVNFAFKKDEKQLLIEAEWVEDENIQE